jgi:hypothetical protein
MTGAGALVEFVKAGPWADADADTRFEILSLLDAVIIKRREKMGWCRSTTRSATCRSTHSCS